MNYSPQYGKKFSGVIDSIGHSNVRYYHKRVGNKMRLCIICLPRTELLCECGLAYGHTSCCI